MGFHTFDPEKFERLEDPTRFRFCSREELLELLPTGDGATVLDVGSGTGFYTAELAPSFGSVVGVDLQPAMHRRFTERTVPENVSLVTADAESLPFQDGRFDAAFSTMTFHESSSPAAMTELSRVLADGGRVAIVDWSGDGQGETGPPVEERFDAAEATDLLTEATFDVVQAAERSETFRILAEK